MAESIHKGGRRVHKGAVLFFAGASLAGFIATENALNNLDIYKDDYAQALLQDDQYTQGAAHQKVEDAKGEIVEFGIGTGISFTLSVALGGLEWVGRSGRIAEDRVQYKVAAAGPPEQ